MNNPENQENQPLVVENLLDIISELSLDTAKEKSFSQELKKQIQEMYAERDLPTKLKLSKNIQRIFKRFLRILVKKGVLRVITEQKPEQAAHSRVFLKKDRVLEGLTFTAGAVSPMQFSEEQDIPVKIDGLRFAKVLEEIFKQILSDHQNVKEAVIQQEQTKIRSMVDRPMQELLEEQSARKLGENEEF